MLPKNYLNRNKLGMSDCKPEYATYGRYISRYYIDAVAHFQYPFGQDSIGPLPVAQLEKCMEIPYERHHPLEPCRE